MGKFVPAVSTYVLLSTTIFSSCVIAQPATPETQSREIDEIQVIGQNVYRDRTNDINPTLSYGLDFFQRFEPQTVGEMLKRTPGVVFTSDVLEYDAVQLRGLGAEYTEVLVNGRRIPGQGADRTFFVDRIPAELVEKIEIIRSPSADMGSEGVAGALNIVLKDGAQIEGLVARLGSTYYGDDDNKTRGSAALAYADAGDGYDYWVGFNVQERRNPKIKVEQYFDEGELEGFAFEDDVRDGDDYSLNGSIGYQLGDDSKLRFNGYFVYTDREEEEFVEEFEGVNIDRNTSDLIQIDTQLEEIEQTSWGFDGLYERELDNGNKFEFSAALSRYDEDTENFETEEEFEDGVSAGVETDMEVIDIEDRSYSLEGSYTFALNNALDLKAGLSYARNEREGLQDGFTEIEADIEETRLAPYVKLTYELSDTVNLQGGFRYDDYERDVESEEGSGDNDASELLPSLSLRWDATDDDRITASIARTVRRPEFDLVTPFEEDETPDDDDITIGNPELDSELSWGFDLGYERRLPGQGIVGINFFYRDVDDLIEITPVAALDDGLLFTPLNVGDAEAWGVEFDLSTPLGFIGLPDTGFYLNYAYLDSEVDDPFTGEERQFRDQPDYVYNVSITQDLPGINAGAGISYQQRGNSEATEFLESVVTEYDANLELFFEINLWENTVLRLTGTNLLDQEKLEFIRDAGEPVNEIQIEESSKTFSLTVRSSF